MYALEDISKEIVQRIRSILAERDLSQTQLATLCQEAGYSITQPEISKIMSSKTKPTLYFLIALSTVFNVPMDYFVGNEKKQAVMSLDNAFAIDPVRDDAFKNILGKYWAYYASTNPYEEKILMGELSFSSGHGLCEASFLLHTGETKEKAEVIKRYNGQMVISTKMRAMYCMLYSSLVSEMCFLIFRFRHFAVKEMLCRMGLAITMSAGEQKQPVAHKYFISRKKLDSEMLGSLLPFLRFAQEDLVIGEEDLEEIIAKYPEDAKIFNDVGQIARKEKRIVIRETDFLTVNRKLSQAELARLKGIGLAEADTLKNVFVSEKEDEILYRLTARWAGDSSG